MSAAGTPADERPFERIACVNRGECAVRLIRAVRELNTADGTGYRALALVTDPDRDALFAREADETFSLGSATFVDPRDDRRKSRYLDYATLERVLRESGAEAAWVGWGFVAEHVAFAELCDRLGIVFLGPGAEVMRALGDKIGSKRMAEKAGVPVAPWSGGPVASLDEARRQAERLGFPLMVKATAGGGGRGIRRVRAAPDLAEAFESARSEALAGFGDDTVFMERLLEGARHVEVQIVGDGRGTTWALGVRDCSVQRRNQKVIEESPSPALTEAEHREVCAGAARLGDLAGYRGAGTVEFLFDPDGRRFSFMEVNARLQVEHPVTECTTGADLVKLQVHVGHGRRLEGDPPAPRGHAIEVRVNAEDPERGFAPSPGRLALFRPPGGAGLRVDSGFVEGDAIAPEFDSMLAKVIAHGRDRPEALARLRRALLEMRLAVRGGTSNKGFLLTLLDRPEVRTGEVDVGWLDRLAADGSHVTTLHVDVALLQGAIDAWEDEHVLERAAFQATAARGRVQLRREVGRRVELRCRGEAYEMRVLRRGPRDWRVDVEGQRLAVRVEPHGALERRLHVAGRRHRVLALGEGLERLVEVDGIPHRLTRDAAGMVRSPAPAVVLSLAVREGDEVARGDRLAVLEAMKTELPVLAPCAGKVREVRAAPNAQVEAGAPLVVLEPIEREDEVSTGERVRFDAGVAPETAPGDARARVRRDLEGLRRVLLGFEVDADEMRRLREDHARTCAELPPDDAELLRGEEELLAIFADVCALFESGPSGPGGGAGRGGSDESRSPEEYFLLYLRSLDAETARVSPAFVDRLRRALRHWGVEDLERTPALEEALLWICKSHARLEDEVGVVIDVLERRLDAAEALVGAAAEADRALLDRVALAARGRFQAVSDLAREVIYRTCDRPRFERVRRRVYAEAEDHLRALHRAPDGPDRETHVRALVECPEPLVPSFCARFEGADARQRRLMLEVSLRRYYRIRPLEDLRTFDRQGRGVASASYLLDGRRVHVLATHGRADDLAPALAALAPSLADVPADEDAMLEFSLWRPEGHGDADATLAGLREALEAAGLPRPVRRVVFAVGVPAGAPEAGSGMRALQHFTLRPDGEGRLVEDRFLRGLHPMMAKRLELWRLANFEIERLPSAEDVYLFHGVARSNPKDERLFAFAEVRDLSPDRDAAGRVRLPRMESMALEALAAIRLFQSRRGRRRLQWNRVLLYVWPPLELGGEELAAVAQRVLPAAEDLGLQKVVLRARMPEPGSGRLVDRIVQAATPGGHRVVVSFTPPAERPIEPLSAYGQQVVRMRQRGLLYPWELIRMIAPPSGGPETDFPPGEFQEHDLDDEGRLRPVDRPPGENGAKVIAGVIRNVTPKHPEGMVRVLLAGDPSREMGSFAEPECRRILAALDLASELGVPMEWFPVSAGAKIAMDTGTENLDWTARVLRRLIDFTQAGGEVNVVVLGVNVGGQSYWNAEATMLMHTRGILVMTPEASMVLTGKKALDYSGGVSAPDHQGIGGYDRIMGPNGQGQYWAETPAEACQILFRHYDHAYVAPGERFPRCAATEDPPDRDVRGYPYGGPGFDHVGEIFGDERNPDRRRPFEIRRVMRAVVDQDHRPLERWADMREAEVAVVWDAHLGGWPVCLVGFESQPLARLGFVPADGPDQWTAGTLFPLSSKKVARAINAASGVQPVVLLANLSGFDGSPESLRRLQLEYGAEIGRAVVNFRGPLVFCVVSRYHGGAYVVFSRRLNEGLEVAALEGSHASVIGGAPAAAVVFTGEVDRRTREDPRLVAVERAIEAADEADRVHLRRRWHVLFETVRSEKLGEVALEFDRTHDVARARRVGSLDHVIGAARLRPYLIEAVERGVRRFQEGAGSAPSGAS